LKKKFEKDLDGKKKFPYLYNIKQRQTLKPFSIMENFNVTPEQSQKALRDFASECLEHFERCNLNSTGKWM
jgi:hypothetical protein